MPVSPSSSGQSKRSESWQKIAWAILIFLTLYICYFSYLGAIGLVGPDEPRYAWIARDMAESGDWITPRLYGQPWFEKPVLYYWGAALSFKIFGVSEAAARLPSALSALLATLALAWLALRLAGRETARWLLVLLPSTIGMIGFSHAAAPDMIFSAALVISMVCAAAALKIIPSQTPNRTGSISAKEHPSRTISPPPDASPKSEDVQRIEIHTAKNSWLSLLLFGFFLGAAVLAKGPAAVILAGGAILLWSIFTKRWRDTLRLFHPIAIAAFLLTSLPWYILCARRNPDFLRIFVIEHNFHRYLTPQFQHIQPFWYYIPITFLALLPWTFWLAWFARREARTYTSQSQRAQIRFLASWGLFPMLFFSLSQSKLPGYILPAIPPLVCVISLAVTRTLNSSSSFPRYALILLDALYFVAAIWLAIAAFTRQPTKGLHWATAVGAPLIFLLVFSLGLGALAIFVEFWRGATSTALLTAIIVTLLVLKVAYNSISRLDPQLSARSAASQIDSDHTKITYSFKLQRAWQYQLNFYLHREIPEWTPDVPGRALVVTNEKNLSDLKSIAQIVNVIWDHSSQAEIVEVTPLPR